MADPRETARAWLAERINTSLGAGGSDLSRAALAGMELDTEYGVQIDGEHSSWYIPMTSAEAAHREVKFAADRGFTAGRTAVERVVIRLPAQPIGETR